MSGLPQIGSSRRARSAMPLGLFGSGAFHGQSLVTPTPLAIGDFASRTTRACAAGFIRHRTICSPRREISRGCKAMIEAYSMADRIVLLTGAGGGIGRASASLLAKAGAQLVLSDRDEECAALAEAFPSATIIPADMAVAESLSRLVNDAHERHGRIDTLIATRASMVRPGVCTMRHARP